MRHPSIRKVGTNFADKRRLLVGIVLSRTKATELVRKPVIDGYLQLLIAECPSR
jgi:hypothetical protein